MMPDTQQLRSYSHHDQPAMLYPIALTNLHRHRCIVIGGGAVAERKVAALLDAGAQVVVVSPLVTAALGAWAAEGRVQHAGRVYVPGDLEGAFLVIAATDQRAVNALVAAEATERGCLCNVADAPDSGNFHTMAVVRRDEVTLAVATSGSAPALAALVRRKLEALFGPEYGALSRWLREVRTTWGPRLAATERVRLARALATDEMLALFREGDAAGVERALQAQLAHLATPPDSANPSNQAGAGDGATVAPPSLSSNV